MAKPPSAVLARLLLLACVLAAACPAVAGPLDEMSIERWAKLREVERYQLNVAEQLYKQANYKAAITEYEKYITLYEKSDGSSYSQLKWGLCQVHLRKANTAIKDGFQSVIDYWPDSPDAALARYHIGRTWLDMGRLDLAKKAYRAMLDEQGCKALAAYVLTDLADIAQVEKDYAVRGECWKKLTFDVKRDEAVAPLCARAAGQYAVWSFGEEAFDEGVRALTTVCAAAELPQSVCGAICPVLSRLAGDDQTRDKANRLCEQAVTWLRKKGPQQATDAAQKEALRKVLFDVADVLSAAGQDKPVIDTYEEALKTCGTNDATLGRLAAWYESRGKFDQACLIYRKFENKTDCLSRIAAGYRRAKQFTAALNTYKEILGTEGANQVRWLVESAATHREAGQPAEAIGIYRELIKLAPASNQQWLWQIGTTHRDAGQYKEAIGVLRQCTNFPENLQVMAVCHRRLKEYSEALLLYNEIGAEKQYAPWAALEIAGTWEEAEKKEEAIKAFQLVCKRFPKSAQASAAHARLQAVYKINMTLGGSTDE